MSQLVQGRGCFTFKAGWPISIVSVHADRQSTILALGEHVGGWSSHVVYGVVEILLDLSGNFGQCNRNRVCCMLFAAWWYVQ